MKKIKTDNINIDILFNEIEKLKTELYDMTKMYRDTKLDYDAFKEVYISMTKKRIERLTEENIELKKEIEKYKNNT